MIFTFIYYFFKHLPVFTCNYISDNIQHDYIGA